MNETVSVIQFRATVFHEHLFGFFAEIPFFPFLLRSAPLALTDIKRIITGYLFYESRLLRLFYTSVFFVETFSNNCSRRSFISSLSPFFGLCGLLIIVSAKRDFLLSFLQISSFHLQNWWNWKHRQTLLLSLDSKNVIIKLWTYTRLFEWKKNTQTDPKFAYFTLHIINLPSCFLFHSLSLSLYETKISAKISAKIFLPCRQYLWDDKNVTLPSHCQQGIASNITQITRETTAKRVWNSRIVEQFPTKI